jgi:transposase-like protein
MTHEQRTAYWRTVVSKHAESGLNAVAFCREQQIKVSQFYRWHRKFRDNNEQEPASKGFLELVPCKKQNGSGIRIRLRDEVSIEVEYGFDALTLRRTVQALNPIP